MHDYEIKKLSEQFYEGYPHDQYQEILTKESRSSSLSHKEVERTRVALTNYGIVILGYAVFCSFARFCFKRSWNISSYSSADGALIIPTPL